MINIGRKVETFGGGNFGRDTVNWGNSGHAGNSGQRVTIFLNFLLCKCGKEYKCSNDSVKDMND